MTARPHDGRMRPGVAVMLALIGLACLLFMTRGCAVVTPHGLGLGGGWFGAPVFGLVGVWFVIQTGLALWVGFDAERRGSNGWLWGLLVVLTPVVGLVVYLIVISSDVLRVPSPDGDSDAATPADVSPGGACPSCARPVEREFKVCPYCGGALGCHECGRRLEPEWKLCPFCGQANSGRRADLSS